MALTLRDLVVGNQDTTFAQDNEAHMNHDSDTLTLGLPSGYKLAVVHQLTRSRTTTALGSTPFKTIIDRDLTIAPGKQVRIQNSEGGGIIGEDRNTTVTFVKATSDAGVDEMPQPSAANAEEGERKAASRAWWNKWWWVALIVVIIVGVAAAYVIIVYMRGRAATSAAALAAGVPVPPSPLAPIGDAVAGAAGAAKDAAGAALGAVKGAT